MPLEGVDKQGLLYAMRLLALTRRSEVDLRKKLNEKGFPSENTDRIIIELKKLRLISDIEMAKQSVEASMFSNPKGRHRIMFELKRKGISRVTAEEALSSYNVDQEKELALRLAEQKLHELKRPYDEKVKKKVYDFLVRRGFDFQTSREAVLKSINQHENE